MPSTVCWDRPLWLSCAVGVFLLKGDLRQHRLGEVGACLCVADEKVLAPFRHCRELIERHKGEGASIIEAPVRVFLYDGRAVRICHQLTPGNLGGIAEGFRSNLSHQR
jgi:hypothetical protein